VARGAIDLYVEMGIHAWDMAAGDIIVREAGGTVMDPAGNYYHNIINKIKWYICIKLYVMSR